MARDENAALELSNRLRELLQAGFETPVQQNDVAAALDRSEGLISSWIRRLNPVTPPEAQLRSWARLFATPRSREAGRVRLVPVENLTPEEIERFRALEAELLAMRAAATGQPVAVADVDEQYLNRLRSQSGSDPWRFPVGETITIVPAHLPPAELDRLPSSDRFDRDYVESYRYGDLDSLFEIHGHLRAVNPDNNVYVRIPEELNDDDRTTHLVVIGGVDWNMMTREMSKLVSTPVRQAGRNEPNDRGGFEILDERGEVVETFEPRFDGDLLVEDVGLFVRAPNPYDRKRSLTICNALYALGVYGVVRSLTAAQFRDRNGAFLTGQLAHSNTTSILCRVPIQAGSITVPDWTFSAHRLHVWPDSSPTT
jgi:hypothetical protein